MADFHIDDPGDKEDVSEQEPAAAPVPVSSDHRVTERKPRYQHKLDKLLIPDSEIQLVKNKDTVLGSGGFGEVFKGQYTRGDKPVAVKLIKKPMISKTEKKKFYNEALLMKRAQHGQVVHIYGIICSDTLGHGLVMEFMKHGSLKDFMVDVNIPFSIRIQMLWDTAEGLQYLNNEIKMAHNDIKEGNIMVDSKFNAKISDFGVAELYQRVTSESLIPKSEENQLRGTEHYIPPEMLKDVRTEPNEQTDIYSYGITVFVVLTHGKTWIFPPGTKIESLIHGWRCPITEDRIEKCIRRDCCKEEWYVCDIMRWVMTNILNVTVQKEKRKKFNDMISVFNSYRTYHDEFLNRDRGILYSELQNRKQNENKQSITQPIEEREVIYSRSLHACSRTSAAPDKEDSRKSCTSDDESRVTEDFKRLQLHRDEHDADSVLTDQNRHKPKLEFAERAATMQAQPVPVHPQAMQAPIQTTSPAKQTTTMQAQPVPAHPQAMQAPIQVTSPQGQGNASHPTMQAPHGYGYGYGYPVGQPQMPAQDPSLYGGHAQQNPQHNPLYYTTHQPFPYYTHPPPYYGQQPVINIYNSPRYEGPTMAWQSGQPANSMTRSASTGQLDVWGKICNELLNYIMKDWKDFLRRSLNFNEVTSKIQEIEYEHRRLKDQVHAALNAWYRSVGYNSTYQDLKQLLEQMGNKMAADQMENILRDHHIELSAVIGPL